MGAWAWGVRRGRVHGGSGGGAAASGWHLPKMASMGAWALMWA